jgi:ankyrin repeat protein
MYPKKKRQMNRHNTVLAISAGILAAGILALALYDGEEGDSSYAGVARLLISNGAALEAKDDFGNTPLTLALLGEEVYSSKLEKTRDGPRQARYRPSPKTPLHNAAYAGSAAEAKRAGWEDVITSRGDFFNCTPLHLAALKGREPVAAVLLERGVSVAPSPRFNPLVHVRDVKLAALMIQKGADANAAEYRLTPLHAAAALGNVPLIKLLLSKGASPAAEDDNGHERPLYLAAKGGHTAAAAALLDHGADVNAAREDGETALHRAAYQGNLALVKLLVERGADIYKTTRGGETAYHLAGKQGEREVLKFLWDRGATEGGTFKAGLFERDKEYFRTGAVIDVYDGLGQGKDFRCYQVAQSLQIGAFKLVRGVDGVVSLGEVSLFMPRSYLERMRGVFGISGMKCIFPSEAAKGSPQFFDKTDPRDRRLHDNHFCSCTSATREFDVRPVG